MIETVAAREVKPGDEIYNSGGDRGWEWVRVKEVEPRDDGYLKIRTTIWDTVKHPAEGVAVRRVDSAEGAAS